jgi:hypothetical protein
VNLNFVNQNPKTYGTSMAFEVVHKRRGGIATASQKPVIDLTKTAPKPAKAPPAKPAEAKPAEPAKPKQQQQQKPRQLHITAAPDGPPIAPDLPEQLRKWDPVRKPLTDKQVEVLDRIIQKAGEGSNKTLGLRLVLAAAEDKHAAAWPIGLLAKALGMAGHATEAHAVFMVAQGCRVARFKDMAAASLTLLNQKLEEAKGPA